MKKTIIDYIYSDTSRHGPIVKVDIQAKPIVSFAMANNGIPPIQRIVVSSDDAKIEAAKLIVQIRDAITPLSHPSSFDVDLEPFQHIEFTEFKNILAADKMRQVEETRQGEVVAWLVKGQETLTASRFPLTVLAHNQWLGKPFGLAMELLSAHVMPNAPEIAALMLRLAHHLKQLTSDPSIDGYQSAERSRVDHIVAAAYEAMAEQGIIYAEPPASWGHHGQKVRTPQEVLEGRLGTCLDLSVVLAAVLEQCGLHPLIFMFEDHALMGWWRDEVNSGELFLNESDDLVNRVDLGEIGVVESTCIPRKLPFPQAVEEAKARIREGLLGASDVVVARESNVFPLPALSHLDGVVHVHEYKPVVHSRPRQVEPPVPSRPSLPRKGQKEPPARVRQWKNHLLDLSLRNRLIHFTPRSAIEILLSPDDLPEVEDVLNAGHPLHLHAVDSVDAMTKERQKDASTFEIPLEVCSDAFKSRKIVYGNLISDTYHNILQKVAYRARTLEEETGANNLYVTLGMLKWKLKDRELLSPLILVPVRLVASRRRGGTYSIVIDEAGESTPNYCLLEKIRLEFGIEIPGLQDPVEDASGIDLQAAFDAVRKASIDAQAGFQVVPDAYLSSLQFNKFRLWKDLDDHWEKILEVPLARHLALNPTEPFVDPVASPSHLDLDEWANTCPIPADGSQVKAIAHALAGRSFVLEGPPGTGKSQTIANLLAQAIFQGKRVLFVAEKRVALEVVSNRVRELGLGEFMIDLHDQKSKPAEVQSQVRAALESTFESQGDSIGFSNAMETLKSAQGILATYAHRLHARNSAGYSLYSANQACIAADPSVSVMPVPEPLLLQAPAERFQQLEEMFRRLPAVADPVFPSPHAPWRFLAPRSSSEIDRHVIEEAARYLQPAALTLVSGPPVIMEIRHPTDAMLTSELLGYSLGPELLQSFATPPWQTAAQSIAARLHQLSLQKKAFQGVKEEFWDAPLAEILAMDGEVRNAGFFNRRGLLQKLATRLFAFGWNTPKLDKNAAIALLDQLSAIKNTAAALASEVHPIPGMSLGSTWNPLLQAHQDAMTYRLGLMQRLVLRVGQGGTFALRLREWLAAGARLTADQHAALRTFAWALGRLSSYVHPDAMQGWAGERGFIGRWLDTSAHRRLEDPNLGSLSQWLAFIDHLSPLVDAGMTSARTAILDGTISSNDAVRAWKRGIEVASRTERARTEGLEVFNTQAHTRSVERFIDNQNQTRALLPVAMAEKVVKKRSFDAQAQAGRIGALKRELTKQRRRKSVRDLMSAYGDLITEALPVVLVSPDSLSRFFALDGPLFDIIVFDEASQVRVSDAIGAIGRARSVVVVGDSKQMPPTSFMQTVWTSDDTEQEEDVVEDEESILVECVQAGLEQQWLTWHYRSQHEALIAFSNQHYYEGRLSSFPTPFSENTELGVSLRRVNGEFIRTKSNKLFRTNPVEAQAIVEEVKRRFETSPDSYPSLGIITFNIQQRAYIEGLLRDTDDERIVDALESRQEGLFVKNLENVQGDERDVILFSTAFGVNEKGILPLQFGPLNRQGGERRLNVAITRARRQVIVFSSFDPSQLRAEQTSSLGIQLLRSYLDAAERGMDTMRNASRRSLVDHHRDEIAKRLEQAGLSVRKDVGMSSFRVDIELSLPQYPEQPRVAVLLDGEAWRARSTVSDRDGMPPMVLGKMMGWPVVERVWMPEWLADPETVITRLVKATHDQPASQFRKKKSQTLVMPTETAPLESEQSAGIPAESLPLLGQKVGEKLFKEAPLRQVGNKEGLDGLLNSYALQKTLVELAIQMLDTEGPVHEERLARFLIASFGVQQVYPKRKQEVLGVVEKHLRKERQFFWPTTLNESTWRDYQPDPEQKRSLLQIDLLELGNAMVDVGKKLGGGFKEELFRETLRVFGIQRLTAQARERLEASLALMVDRSRVVVKADNLVEPL